MIRRAALPLLLLAGCASESPVDNAAASSAVPVTPGLWEIQSAVTAARAPNLPILIRDRLVGPRPGRRVCISAAQAADASFLAQRTGTCVQREVALRNGRLTGTMVCRQAGGAPSVVTLQGAYGPGHYALRMEMAEPMPDGMTLRLDVVTTGRRIGDC
jgi:hypothetical protein